MFLELRHLRSIEAIHNAGGLARAADQLNITQSALSHQIKGLEDRAGLELVLRRSKPMTLSPAGHKVLRLAHQILPEVSALEAEFQAMQEGHSGRLHIAIECHACFEWLFPVLELFRRIWPDVDVDIRAGLSFDAMAALDREEVDLVISSDPVDLPDMDFSPLFDYEPVFIAAKGHPLASKPYVEAQDFADQTLIAYPVEKTKLDVFSTLLTPGGIEPLAIRPVELTSVIMLLVASNRGVAVLPDWVVRDSRYNHDYVTRPLTRKGITKRLFAVTRQSDTMAPYMAHFTRLARTEPLKLQRKA